jgi:hypothetical protein
MIRPTALWLSVTGLVVSLAAVRPAPAEVTAERSDHGVTIRIDGKPFAEYWTRSGAKPIVWPIIGPTGQPMTRAYPMGEAPNEKKDHVHQRSLWFTHGSVNGVSFWDELTKHGTEQHREFVTVRGGREALVETRNDWIGPDGKKQLEDQRSLTFGVDGAVRWIDFDITLQASVGPVRFGDTKEGTFGMRIAETMKVDAKPGGHIVNSDGLVDKNAWGKRASWVDYQGPVDGKKVGIAILNHPCSFRYPTYWHVRTYGLFAANPFGLRDFVNDKSKDGSYTLPKGQSLRLRYRVLLHEGDEKQGRVAEIFAGYAKQAK